MTAYRAYYQYRSPGSNFGGIFGGILRADHFECSGGRAVTGKDGQMLLVPRGGILEISSTPPASFPLLCEVGVMKRGKVKP